MYRENYNLMVGDKILPKFICSCTYNLKPLHKYCLFGILYSVQTHNTYIRYCMPDVQLTKQLFDEYLTSAWSLIFHFWFRHIIVRILINIACVHLFGDGDGGQDRSRLFISTAFEFSRWIYSFWVDFGCIATKY